MLWVLNPHSFGNPPESNSGAGWAVTTPPHQWAHLSARWGFVRIPNIRLSCESFLSATPLPEVPRSPFVTFALAIAFASSAFSTTPSYGSASIVNAASNAQGPLAPNCLASLYGADLSYVTAALTGGDLSGATLPFELPGTGVHVSVGGLTANVLYVSPTQINFLVPAFLLPGPTTVQVARDGIAGPAVSVTLAAQSPGLFQLNAQQVVATRASDYSVITSTAPAHAGEWILLWATGLGDTVPPVVSGELAPGAAQLQDLASFALLLNGTAVDPKQIGYAGLAPGFAGLYQINLQLPEGVSANPEIRLSIHGFASPPGIQLPVK